MCFAYFAAPTRPLTEAQIVNFVTPGAWRPERVELAHGLSWRQCPRVQPRFYVHFFSISWGLVGSFSGVGIAL